MEFARTEAQQALHDEVADFARRELNVDNRERDLRGEFSSELWKRAADFGVLAWNLPKERGGIGHSVSTTAYLMEALGYGCRDNGLTFALGAQLWGVQTALLHFGNDEQIERYLEPSRLGQAIGAYGMTEACSGSDAFELETSAVAKDDGYVLNGEKVLVTFAPMADFSIVFAKTKPEAKRWGISTFLVDAETMGYRAEPVDEKMGLRTVPFGRLTLENCWVPKSALLGKEGAGASIFSFSQGWERSLVLAPQLGALRHLIETCVEFARSRKRGGQAISSHQAVSHKIANMHLSLETGRLLLYKTAWLQECGKPSVMEAALTKTYLAESFTQASLDAITIHGGDGYRTETEIERNLRDAVGGMIYGGTVDIQRNIIAGLMGLK